LIKHLIHTGIDRHLWDDCIERSVNRMPYAFSWWLDAACEGWEALVKDDYSAVMPLTRNRKLGIDYLYQPFFTQQLGIFSQQDLGPGETDDFLAAIPPKYRYIDIQLNAANNPLDPAFAYAARKNFTLDLTPSYTLLSANYHRNCRRNIQKAIHAGLRVKQGPGPTLFIRFIRQHLDSKLRHTGGRFYPVMHRLITRSVDKGTGEIWGVYSPGLELMAAGWFVTVRDRCLFLVCASTPLGKEKNAIYLLVDEVIRNQAGTERVFDFTGSNLAGVAYFNAGFGSKETTYLAAKRNLLPWPLRLLK
jgi:hypothetical protein